MGTTGSPPMLHAPMSLASLSFPTSLVASFPTSSLDSEIPGDGNDWMGTNVVPSYYSASYSLPPGYGSGSTTNVRLYGDSSVSEPGFNVPANPPLYRREEVRYWRNKSEQRRRDGLHGGFARLKDILPAASQRGSKMSLVERDQMQARLTASELEVIRLRHLSETLTLEATEHFSSQSPL
ncbi:hypothetical protein FRC08_011152 [Ceratobasidium sp. 394]|nr:hypothetical protein FRC08_011152 [Ceratobasidium sp. 394]